MTTNVSQENGITVVDVSGSIDSSKAELLEQRINELLAGGVTQVLVDFAHLEYTSSAGLRVLLATVKKLKASGGRFAVCGLNENVLEVFTVTHLHEILRLFGTRQEALAAGLL